MAASDLAGVSAAFDQRRPEADLRLQGRVEPIGPWPQPVGGRPVRLGAAEPPHDGEIILGPAGVWDGRGLGVETGDRLRRLADKGRFEPPSPGELVQQRAVFEPSHDHDPVERRPIPAQPHLSVREAGHRQHPLVERPGEAPVQLELGLAGRAPLLEAGEVDERQTHSALELVDALPAQEDVRQVGADPAQGPGLAGRRAALQRSRDRSLSALAVVI